MLEDLKDMLTDKSKEIQDLLKRRLEVEKEIKEAVNVQLLAHIADIWREVGEESLPYAVTQNYSNYLIEMINDSTLAMERRRFRAKNDDNLWFTLFEDIRKEYLTRMKHITYEA